MQKEFVLKAKEIGFDITEETTILDISNIAAKAIFIATEDDEIAKYVSDKYKMYSNLETCNLLYNIDFIVDLILIIYEKKSIKVFEKD